MNILWNVKKIDSSMSENVTLKKFNNLYRNIKK
jgi:hypothetical protein